MAEAQSSAGETVVQRTADGQTVIHRTVREWHQHSAESLPEIERTIDSWGRHAGAPTTTMVPPERRLDYEFIETQVDRLTRRVKSSGNVVVTETVTEWEDRPVAASGSSSSSQDNGVGWTPDQTDAELPSAQVGALKHAGKRPRRRFGFFGRNKKEAAAHKGAPVQPQAAKDYQPQCAALTDDGAQCRNSARHGSKYCASHFGYQPPTTKGLAKRIEGDAWDPDDKLTDRASVATADTRPVVRKAKDTKVSVRHLRKAKAKVPEASRKKR